MLCDDLIASDSPVVPPELKADIAAAQKFVLSANAVAMVDHVSKFRPSSVAKAVPVIRSPYGLVWVEWREADRLACDPRKEQFFDNGKETPERIGFLVNADPDKQARWTVTMAWSHRTQGINSPLLQVWADWTASPNLLGGMSMLGDPVEEIQRRLSEGVSESTRKRYLAVLKSDEEISALRELSKRCMLFPSTYHVEILNALASRVGQERLFSALHETWTEVGEEIPFIVSSFILLNCRNGIEADEVSPPEKLNKARIRRGKPPLMAHKVLRTTFGGGRLRAGQTEGMSDAQIRAHFVKGHFKVRQTGVFWWTPHVRGKGPHFIHKDYEVSG